MNNIFDILMSINKNPQYSNAQQNTYPNFSSSEQNKSNIISSILPLLLSNNGGLPDLSTISNSNPLISSILSTMQNKEPTKKIESDKIDISSLSKV